MGAFTIKREEQVINFLILCFTTCKHKSYKAIKKKF